MILFGNIAYLDKHISLLKKYTGQDIFLVGGCVRDILMGISIDPHDIDATGDFSPDTLFHSLQQHAHTAKGLFRTEKFGTTTMILSGDLLEDKKHDEVVGETAIGERQTDTYSYEITPFREETGYSDHRHPDEITWTASLIADAGRRDFTINAMYYTSIDVKNEISPIGDALQVDMTQLMKQLTTQGRSYIVGANLLIIQSQDIWNALHRDGVLDAKSIQTFFANQQRPYDSSQGIRILIDPKLGLQDILAQKVRTVGEANKRFHEDALRILRALRFVNIRNQQIPGASFDFHKDTWTSIKKQYYLVQYLAKERIYQELVKVFSANNPFGYVALLDECNLLQYIFPALARCKYNDQPIRYHPFDTYSHILLTLWHLQTLNTHYLVKLGMLYHDVGKPDQYYYYAQCKTPEEIAGLHGSWANHIVCGSEFALRDFAALGFSTKECEEIAWYVAMHMRPGQILEARDDNQIKKIRALYSEVGYERLKNVFDICRADRLGQYNPLQGSEIHSVDTLYTHLNYLRDTEGQFTKKDMVVNGDVLMKEFGLSAGPMIGELLEKAFQWILHETESKNKKETILSYIKGVLLHETEKTI